jgi:hypothetical protein
MASGSPSARAFSPEDDCRWTFKDRGPIAPPWNGGIVMAAMGSWHASLGTAGVIVANLMLLGVRLFARSQGLEVRWWSHFHAPERQQLRVLSRSSDQAVALRARWYLRLEIVAWIVFALSAITLFSGIAGR